VNKGGSEVWKREYTQGIVFSKPRDSGGSITIDLGGSYYYLNADGTHGSAITSITLQDGTGGAGTGAVLISVTQPGDTTPPANINDLQAY
jgi:hypothetical protein